MFFLGVWCLVMFVESASGANILFVNPVASPSHHIWNEVLVNALLERGHNITLIGHQDPKIKSENYTVLKLGDIEEVYEEVKMNDLIDTRNSPIQDLLLLWDYIWAFADLDLNSEALKELLEYPRDTFDLIIFDIVCGQYLYPLIQHFGDPPVVGLSPFALPPYIMEAMGMEYYSYYPIHVASYTDSMTFLQRVENLGLHLMEHYWKSYHLPRLYQFAQKRFGEDITPFDIVERQIQIFLVNYDYTLDFPVPLPPHVIPVGGLHTRRTNVLPKDLKKILDSATNGVIYFSFGTNIQPSALPMEKKTAILKTFSRLKEIVLWKYNGDDLDHVPQNVIIRKWYSQNDILGHKNVKLFITHGGGLSTREAMYHGVPVIGISIFLDQRNNAAKMEARMLGKRLHMTDLDEDTLYTAIQEVINNPIYKQNMRKISKLFRDQKETPLERAVFWVEYVLKHRNVSHLSTRSRYMSVFERQNFDIYMFVFVCLLTVIIPVCVVVKYLVDYIISMKSVKIKDD